MKISDLKKNKEWRNIDLLEPISYNTSVIEDKKEIILNYTILGLKRVAGEIFCSVTISGKKDYLIFDDLPASVQNTIGLKLL